MIISADTNLAGVIKAKATDLGFDLCGIAPSKNLKEHGTKIREWISAGMNGEMTYLGQNIDKRINPGILFPGAKSVIVTGLNYFTDNKQGGNGIPIISKYAYGVRYQDVILKKLNRLLEHIQHYSPDAKGRSFVDSSPVIEKGWASEAGLGFPGRHSILINKNIGSFFFIGIIILDIELDYDQPFTEDLCGPCRLCIYKCPTNAINNNRTIDVRKCISYLTIESKAAVPEDLIPKMGGRVFGCDICQEVCPWNKKSKHHITPEFKLSGELERMSLKDWQNLTSDQYERMFKNSPIARRTYHRFLLNIEVARKSNT